MKKVILASVALIAVAALAFNVNFAKGKVKSYYAGDAIYYHGQTIVASTNSDALEVFVLTDSGLDKRVDLQPFDARFGKNDNFYDAKFSIEDNNLYVYAISGFSLYKYDFSNLQNAELVKSIKNTSWEWYNRVDKFGDNIVTISSRGVKVWNNNLDIIDSHVVKNDVPYNIRSNNSGQYIFNIKESEIEIYDRVTRQVVRTIQVDYRSANGNRNLYFDTYDNKIYVVDDISAKKFDFATGALEARFEHIGYPGYDVASSDNEFLYFSNGLGVVKLKKDNMELVRSKHTNDMAGPEGWAMGMKVVGGDEGGERIVVFNNSSILVLNNKLEKLGEAKAKQDTDKPSAKENLFLNVDRNTSTSNSYITLSGGGYFPGEKLEIQFAGQKFSVTADSDGRFKQSIKVPEIANKPVDSSNSDRIYVQNVATSGDHIFQQIEQRTDIKVTGDQSKLHYSLGFQINQIVSQ